MTLVKQFFVCLGARVYVLDKEKGACARKNIRPLQMCAAWTSALLSAIVKEAVKMVGSSAQQSSLVRKLH